MKVRGLSSRPARGRPGEATVAAIRDGGGEAVLEVLDTGDRASIRDLVERAAASYGGSDIIVHNAAHMPFGARSVR